MKRLLLTCTDLMAVQFLVPHVKHLSEHGFSVELACSQVGGRLEELRGVLDGIAPVRQVRLVRSPFSARNRHGYADLKAIIDSEPWDLIWTNEPVMGVVTRLAAREARKRGTKVVYMVHGFHFYTGAPKLNWLLYYPVEKYCSRLCDMIVTINREDRQRAGTFHAPQVELIPGIGVDLTHFEPDESARQDCRALLGLSENDIMLLSVGELNPNKNQRVLIEALAQLHNIHVKLFLCGKGELESALRQQITELHLENQVQLLGYRRDIPALCCAADLFVFSSRREGLPRALLEAMATGTAVVCSDIRGNVDLVQHGKGGLVTSGQPDSMATAINKLIADPQLRQTMACYNIEYVQRFSIENCKAQILALFAGLTE